MTCLKFEVHISVIHMSKKKDIRRHYHRHCWHQVVLLFFFLSFFKQQFWHHINTSIPIKHLCFHSYRIVSDRGYFIIISLQLMCRLLHIHMFNLISFMSGKMHNTYIKRNTKRQWEKKLRTIIHILWPRDII